MIYILTIAAVIWALGVTANMFREIRRDRGQTKRPLSRGEKTYPIDPLYLPFGLGFFALVMLIWPGPSVAYMIFKISFLPAIFLISAYHSLLYFSLPLIRRLFSSRAIIALWIIPNVLYFFVIHAVQPARRLYVTLPAEWFSRLSGLWFAGFSAVMVWFIVSHLRYRTSLLAGAGPVSPGLSDRWQAAQTRFKVKHPIPALVHPAITSPLTIGCFNRTMRLVLPDKDYSELDLDLIFSHELTHIQRSDAGTKFFMIFCKALAWFNPLSWLTASQVARDIELSADEAVLTGADQALRRHYAGLIIHNAGCPGGFTTCLSASAESLRYRLQQIMAPRRRLSGVFLIGLTTFLLIMSLGRIGLARSAEKPDRAYFCQPHESTAGRGHYPGGGRKSVFSGG